MASRDLPFCDIEEDKLPNNTNLSVFFCHKLNKVMVTLKCFHVFQLCMSGKRDCYGTGGRKSTFSLMKIIIHH